MTVREMLGLLVATTFFFTGVGGVTGYALGTFLPGYYRSVFIHRSDDFDPVAVGIGQGVTQGITGGAVVSVFLIGVLAWYRVNAARYRGSRAPMEGEARSDSDGSSRPGRSRLSSIIIGGFIGLCVGAVWTTIMGPLTDGPPSMALSFAIYANSLTFTGLIVGAVQRYPALVGLGVGVATLSNAALIFGPNDAWMGLWLMVFGGSGIVCGLLIGSFFYLAQRRRTA